MNVVGQLYQFTRMGFEGYKEVNKHMLATTALLRDGLLNLGLFEVISTSDGLPLVTFHLKDDPDRTYDEFQIADRLRTYGWVVPAYTLAKNNEARKVLRIVCRWDFEETLAAELLVDIKESIEWLECHFIYTKDQLAEIEARAAAKSKVSEVARKWKALSLNKRGKC